VRTVDLKIHDIAFGGKGVGRDQGKAVFVPFTIEDEFVSAEIVRGKKQFAEADVVEIKERSPHRVAPPCPYFGRCGGCAYQHIDYTHQIAIKWRQVRDLLQRIGKIPEPPMRPIIASPRIYSYRNRITVHVIEGVIGFFERESNRLIDIEQCPISTDGVNRELQQLRQQAPRDGHYALRASTGPRIFSQTNDAVAELLHRLVVEMIPADQDLLIDAYCGAGFFTKALLDKFDRVVGIDWDRFAIEEAGNTATPKETYIAGDVEEALGSRCGGLLTAESKNPAVKNRRSFTIIVDPPATGLTSSVRNAIIDLAPNTLIYVSCNPATLARDLKNLVQTFRLESVTPVDMFPQTAEIEAVAQLTYSVP
jgi:23S rRNA (uracil1939-C5)-methyltransferase